MSFPSLHDIARAMGGEVIGDRACFPTPGHSKKDRGSWASIVPSAPDGVLIHSSNGGDPLQIKDELRKRGVLPPLFAGNDNVPWRAPERVSAPADNHGVRLNPEQKIVATFEYHDCDGKLLYRKHRIEPGRNRSKDFAYDHPEGQGWAAKRQADAVPYRLQDLIASPKTLPIFMAEGEAKADRLAEWGFVATSHKDWKSFDFSGYVKGRKVFILPDNDETGAKLAQAVLEAIETAEGTAHLVELPGLGHGEDILDWRGCAEDLRKLAHEVECRDAAPIPTLDLLELSKAKAQPKEFVIERLAPAGEVTLFTGAGSAGKSLLAQQLATAAAAGTRTLGFSIEQMSSIYVTCEDDPGQLHWRQEHICAALNAPLESLAGKLHLASLRGELGSELATFAADGVLKPTRAFDRLSATIRQTGSRLAFLDNVAHLFTGNENDRGEVTRFVGLLNRLAGETGAALILLGHPNKAGDTYSGSTAWLNAVRSQFMVEHDEKTDARTLTIGKANYARKGDQTRFFWHEWAFVAEDDLPPDRARDLFETQRSAGHNEIFLACLSEMARQKRAVSESPNAANFAPKVFLRMSEAKGLTKPMLVEAMDRLFRRGMIERAELWRGPDRKPVFGLRTVCNDEALSA